MPSPDSLAPALAVLMGLASPCTLADRPSHDEVRHHDEDRHDERRHHDDKDLILVTHDNGGISLIRRDSKNKTTP